MLARGRRMVAVDRRRGLGSVLIRSMGGSKTTDEYDGGETSNSDKKQASSHFRYGASPTHRHTAARQDKAFAIAPSWPDPLGVTAACRNGSHHGSRLRRGRRTPRRHLSAAVRRDCWNGCHLSRAAGCLAAGAAIRLAPIMKTATRRSLRRIWRVMTWPLSGHVVFALATGLASGFIAAHYPSVVSAPYAAILGTLVLYPLMVAMWWHLHRSGGRPR